MEIDLRGGECGRVNLLSKVTLIRGILCRGYGLERKVKRKVANFGLENFSLTLSL